MFYFIFFCLQALKWRLLYESYCEFWVNFLSFGYPKVILLHSGDCEQWNLRDVEGNVHGLFQDVNAEFP
jgi:hypothetical protein